MEFVVKVFKVVELEVIFEVADASMRSDDVSVVLSFTGNAVVLSAISPSTSDVVEFAGIACNKKAK